MKEQSTIETSHVYQHNILNGHDIDFEGVEILDTARTALKLQFKEMLYIRKLTLKLKTLNFLLQIIII